MRDTIQVSGSGLQAGVYNVTHATQTSARGNAVILPSAYKVHFQRAPICSIQPGSTHISLPEQEEGTNNIFNPHLILEGI